MRKVAREAGLSVTTLYNHFGSKSEIRVALCVDLLDDIDRELAEIPLDRPIERAAGVITVGAAHVVGAGEVTRTALLAAAASAGSPDIASPRSVEMQRVALQAAMDGGLLRSDLAPELLAAQVYEGFSHAALRWATRELDHDGFRDKALYGLYVCLLSVATEETRPSLVAALREIEARVAARTSRAA